MNVTGDVSGSKVKSVTISKGFIYGAAVVFTTIGGLPYIEIQNISFWLENCDVSVASLSFSKIPAPLTYTIGGSSKTTTSYGTNIAAECADHVIYTFIFQKQDGLSFINTLTPAWLVHNTDALTFTIANTSIAQMGDYKIIITADYENIGNLGTV